jgi:hypothetical protein
LMINNCSKRNSNWEIDVIVWYDSAICRQGKKCKKHGGFPSEVSDMARNMKMELLTFSLILSEAASFLGQTTSYKTEVQEREPWVFYEWITCNEKPRCAPNIFPGMFWREI